ncbi:MAG: heavy-metal-associated domain-containing protein [Nitrospinae bacterium]|nr:heavy-metal-associated domain-containing protein [Nitrospinota bacterium]
MNKNIFSVPNISCGHCVNAIKSELIDLAGVLLVEGDPVNKTITVEWEEPATLEAIKKRLEDINYPAA